MSKWPNNTAVWQRLRRVKLAANPLCEECLPKTVLATDVDHVKAIDAGGEGVWDLENLRSLCHECHSRKTRCIDVLHKDSVPMKPKGVNAQTRNADRFAALVEPALGSNSLWHDVRCSRPASLRRAFARHPQHARTSEE